jgi:hypothetical protein
MVDPTFFLDGLRLHRSQGFRCWINPASRRFAIYVVVSPGVLVVDKFGSRDAQHSSE